MSQLPWTADELRERPEWNHRLDARERKELLDLLATQASPGELVGDAGASTSTDPADFPLPVLSERLAAIQQQLETGAGAVRVRGFPIEGLGEAEARLLYWAMAVHLGTPVSQSARGEHIFSVRDAGLADSDPRARGPNTRKRLTFHTDRADVVGFLCLQQAREGGENEISSSAAIYDAMERTRPDLAELLRQPFYYLRHTIDTGNDLPWCQQPVFSFRDGYFACCLLRVLIERAHSHPDLPDLTAEQVEALDLVETIADETRHKVVFRQEAGDLIWLNNWLVLHKRQAFTDWAELEKRRHILRLWLSVPNSRPLDPFFADHFGAVEAGAIRGGIHPATDHS
ncbi:MAG: hypothetical protein GKS06_14585 [Acidobacteria bacterium]|nr:hypothetical protein [Acidobacteriota bacterium]